MFSVGAGVVRKNFTLGLGPAADLRNPYVVDFPEKSAA